MADHLKHDEGSGAKSIATDEDPANIHHQLVKVEFGADGTATMVEPTVPLPVVTPLEWAKGQLAGHSVATWHGRNPDIDALKDIWIEGQAAGPQWVAPTAARTHDIVSADANDTSAGTGARTVKVEGLDASGVYQTENLTLNGVTNVPTVSTYTMVDRLTVLTAGSTGSNAGKLTATAQTDATVTCAMGVGRNRSEQAIYMVPTGKTAYLSQVHAGGQGTAQDVMIDLCVMPSGGLWEVWQSFKARTSGVGSFWPIPYLSVPADATIKLQATPVGTNADIFAGFSFVLV